MNFNLKGIFLGILTVFLNASLLAEAHDMHPFEHSFVCDDSSAALTNPICYEVFSEIGVPLNPPTGLTVSLVNQARQQKLDAQNELDQLLETGRLPRMTWQFEDLSNQI